MEAKLTGQIAWLAAIMVGCAMMLLSLLAHAEPLAAVRRSALGALAVGAVVWLFAAVLTAVLRECKGRPEADSDESFEEV